MGIEETRFHHYESLLQRLWTIPVGSSLKDTDHLGSEHYSKVKKGYVLRGESNIEAAMHTNRGNF